MSYGFHPNPSLRNPKARIKITSSSPQVCIFQYLWNFPIIVSPELSKIQVDAALKILKRRKKVIGWHMADIWDYSNIAYAQNLHGRWSQTKCTTSTLTKSFDERGVQERGNKVVRCWNCVNNSNNNWVSPVQCVPKREVWKWYGTKRISWFLQNNDWMENFYGLS